MKILIVEDDPKSSATMELYLSHAGYQVTRVFNGDEGLREAQTGQYVLAVLDLMLPGRNGLDICRELRKTSRLPVIMVTARTAEDERITGLDLGADDYLGKPFSPRELVSRVKAVLRRTQEPTHQVVETITYDGLSIDPDLREVSVDDVPISLTPKEYQILLAMAKAPGRTFTRDELIERAFGDHFEGADRTVDVHMVNLRKKIEPDRSNPRFIHTVFGIGYRFAGRSS